MYADIKKINFNFTYKLLKSDKNVSHRYLVLYLIFSIHFKWIILNLNKKLRKVYKLKGRY